MHIELHEVDAPFPIPPDLRKVLEAHVPEYGTGGGVGETLPGERAWIAMSGSDVVGYAWITTATLPNGETGTYFSQAVLPPERRRGVGAAVRTSIEDVLRSEGVSSLWVQVNNRNPAFGLGVRLRLIKCGYAVDRKRVEQHYLGQAAKAQPSLSDEDLAREYILPLHFRKFLL